MNGKLAVAGVFAALVSVSTGIAQEGNWQGRPAPNSAVVYGFADISDLPTMAEGPVKETCSDYAVPAANTSTTTTKPLTEGEEAKLADGMTKELVKRLAKKMSVTFAQPADIPAAGSLVFTGCFVGADPGSGGKRLVGMGLGASHLSAHVRVYYVGASGPEPADEFDLAVKGSNKLPPLGAVGLAFNGVSGKRKTLQGDAKRLADDILKRLKKDHLL